MESNLSSEDWADILKDWKRSGKRRVDFCRDLKLKVSAFDYWRKKLLYPVESSDKRLVRLALDENLRFTRPRIMQLKMGQRYTLEFQEDISEAQLLKVLKVLRDLA